MSVKISWKLFFDIFVIILGTAIFSFGNYCFNKVLDDEDIKEKVFNQYFDRNYYESYEKSFENEDVEKNYIL